MMLPKGFAFTQSNLQDYDDCPYRFYLRYFRHIKWPALVVDDAVEFEKRGQSGAHFHRLIQQYLLGVPENRISAQADAAPDPAIARWWEDFLLNVPPWLEGTQLVETTLTTTLDGFWLLAKYDLILVKEQTTFMIFDWKTSQRQIRKDWLLERIQTRLYRFILVQAGASLTNSRPLEAGAVTMNYWFAPHPQDLLSLPYHPSEYEADKVFFTSLVNEISCREEETFFRTTNLSKCRYCVYRSHCDRGTQAGDIEAFEDFGIEPVDSEIDIEFEEIAEIKF